MFLSFSLFGIGFPALELAGRCGELGLSIEMEISRRAFAYDIMWSGEVSDGPMSSTQLSHLRSSGLTPDRSTKTLSATQLVVTSSYVHSYSVFI